MLRFIGIDGVIESITQRIQSQREGQDEPAPVTGYNQVMVDLSPPVQVPNIEEDSKAQ